MNNIINDNYNDDFINIVKEQKVKQEELIKSYSRTKGLNLYAYNMDTSEVVLVEIFRSKTIAVKPYTLELYDPEHEKSFYNSNCIYFESLNFQNAINRINKFRSGKIKDLCNLKPPLNNSIKF